MARKPVKLVTWPERERDSAKSVIKHIVRRSSDIINIAAVVTFKNGSNEMTYSNMKPSKLYHYKQFFDSECMRRFSEDSIIK